MGNDACKAFVHMPSAGNMASLNIIYKVILVLFFNVGNTIHKKNILFLFEIQKYVT